MAIGILALMTLLTLEAKVELIKSPEPLNTQATEQTEISTEAIPAPSLLWVSQTTQPQSDPLYRGFLYQLEQNSDWQRPINVRTINARTSTNIVSAVNSELSKAPADYLVIVGDELWQQLAPLSLASRKIGLMLSEQELTRQKEAANAKHFAISYQQPIERYFALIQALDLFHVQTASFFDYRQKDTKLKFTEVAKHYNVPYLSVEIEPKFKSLDAMNTLHNCCKILLLKQHDFADNSQLQKSVLFNSYKHRIMVIADRARMLNDGAMLALFTEPHSVGKQAARMIWQLENQKLIEPYQQPDEFMIDSNRNISKLLGFKQLSIGQLIQATKNSEQIFGASNSPKKESSID